MTPLLFASATILTGCSPAGTPGSTQGSNSSTAPAAEGSRDRITLEELDRRRMVEQQLVFRGIRNRDVLDAMRKVPRHMFVPPSMQAQAYGDHPLPIGRGQTISQPYIVGLMSEIVEPKPTDRILEIGTGSGYQAAVLAELAERVYSIELIQELADSAQLRLKELGYENIEVRHGDGYLGWPTAAPFDSIVVTCGADHVPEPLFQQLRPGGKLVIPVGPKLDHQELQVIEKSAGGERKTRNVIPVRFVPLLRGEESGSDDQAQQ